MLFERIRRGQKPVFIFLAVMFGLGFVALGVGSGAGGINLGDILNTSSGGSGSISDLSAKTRDHPNDAPAWLQLAEAYQADNQTDAADRRLPALHRAAPEGPDRPLGRRGAARAARAADAEPADQGPGPRRAVHVAVDGVGGTVAEARSGALALGCGRPRAAVQHRASRPSRRSSPRTILQATAIRQKLVDLDPKNAPYQFALAQDAAAGRQYTTAAKALKAYLDLEPNLDPATRQQLEQTLKALQAYGTTPSTP